MDDQDATKSQEPKGDATVALFLGLYLVVLAFFILLVTISTLEETKSRRVMDSLSSEFTSVVPPSTTLQVFQSKDGDVLAGQEFQKQITGLFATAIQVTRVETVQPGRIMRMVVRSDALFFPDEARIRPAQYPLLDRVVAALSSRPKGLRYDLEFIIGTESAGDKGSLPIAQTLEMQRAGVFARDMLSRGVPPDSIAVGMEKGDPKEITLWFFTRDIETSKLRFKGFEEATPTQE